MTDPLLQPYRLRHLTLRNRLMTTAHEPAYPEEGMPKARYRADHVERAKGDVSRDGDRLAAAIGSNYDNVRAERRIDQVVVNDGTVPNEELYYTLKPLSANLGEVDHDRLLAGQPQSICRNPQGTFRLFRVGDAVACRNTHAAIYDALRLVKDL